MAEQSLKDRYDSKVPLGDLPLRSSVHAFMDTLGSAEHAERVKANGLACLVRLHGDLTWEDWFGVGAALQIITSEALAEVGASKWDPDNKRAVKAFTIRWDEYESGVAPTISRCRSRSARRCARS